MAQELEQIEGEVSRISPRNSGGFQLKGYDGWFNISQYAKPVPEIPVVGDYLRCWVNNKGYVEEIEIVQEAAGPRRAPQQQSQQQQPAQSNRQAPGNQRGNGQAPRQQGGQQSNQPSQSAQPPAQQARPPATPELPLEMRLNAMALELAVQYAASRPNSASEHITPLAKRFKIFIKTGDVPALPSNGGPAQPATPPPVEPPQSS